MMLMNTSLDITPFEKLRARTFVWRALLAVIVSSIILAIFSPVPLNETSHIQQVCFELLIYFTFLLFTLPLMNRTRISYKRLIGKRLHETPYSQTHLADAIYRRIQYKSKFRLISLIDNDSTEQIMSLMQILVKCSGRDT